MEPRFRMEEVGAGTLGDQAASDLRKIFHQEISSIREELSKEWLKTRNAFQLYVVSAIAFVLAGDIGLRSLATGLIAGGIPPGISYLILCLGLIGVGIVTFLLARAWANSSAFRQEATATLRQKVEGLRQVVVAHRNADPPTLA